MTKLAKWGLLSFGNYYNFTCSIENSPLRIFTKMLFIVVISYRLIGGIGMFVSWLGSEGEGWLNYYLLLNRSLWKVLAESLYYRLLDDSSKLDSFIYLIPLSYNRFYSKIKLCVCLGPLYGVFYDKFQLIL